QLARDAADDVVELTGVVAHVEATYRPDLRDGEVAAEKAVPLAQNHPSAGACGSNRCAQARRSTPRHDHIGIGEHVGLALGDTHRRKVAPRARRRRRRGPGAPVVGVVLGAGWEAVPRAATRHSAAPAAPTPTDRKPGSREVSADPPRALSGCCTTEGEATHPGPTAGLRGPGAARTGRTPPPE